MMVRSPDRLSAALRSLTVRDASDLMVLAIIYGFLLTVFTPTLLLSQTITAGGDTSAQYVAADYMSNHLLPQGRLIGWFPGWYGGMPMFQNYFIPPFLLMGILAPLIGLPVAFKLVTVLGIFLLPPAAYAFMRLHGFKYPMPAFAAVFSLAFLFMENNSMWGGNIPSTLAGEFSESISLSLTLVFFGLLYRGLDSGRWLAANTMLFALIALTHIYTILWAVAATPAYLLVRGIKPLKKRLSYAAVCYPLAFFLTAFWTFPMLARIGYTTPYALRWYLREDIIPPILWPFLALAAAGLIIGIYSSDRRMVIIAWSGAVCGMLLIIAPYIGFVDIRFVPFVYMLIILLAAYGAGWPASRMRGAPLAPIIAALIVVFWVSTHQAYVSGPVTDPSFDATELSIRLTNWTYVGYIPFWAEWNYNGFERKANWLKYRAVTRYLEGDVSSARVKFEHSESYNEAGSVRAFENIPLFSGRSIVEGLYMHSIPTSPFSFYLQSEVSDEISCPFWKHYPCTGMDLDLGTRHLRMFNAGHIVARSKRLRAALTAHPEWSLAYESPPYSVWELISNPGRYVTVPKNRPKLIEGGDHRNISYEWFKSRELIDIPLVFVDQASPADIQAFGTPIEGLSHASAEPMGTDCTVTEDIQAERIEFTTDCTGLPHIISISHYPSWQVSGADRIYLVSPSFMLVIPSEERVVISYEKTFIDWLGILVSAMALGSLLAAQKAYERLSHLAG